MAAHPSWRWRHVLAAPHRLAFLLAMVVLSAAALQWLAVQCLAVQCLATRGTPPAGAVPAGAVHAAVMALGFWPLFFAGFVFTALPRWLGLSQPAAGALQAPLLAQAAGWLGWLSAPWLGRPALAGLAAALAGQAVIVLRLAVLLRASPVRDKRHARCLLGALAAGCVALAALLAAGLAQDWDLVRRVAASAVFAAVLPVFLTAADRLIPFFSTEALPGRRPWPAAAELPVLLGLCGTEALLPWLGGLPGWALAMQAGLELLAGLGLLGLALAWLRTRRPRGLAAMFMAGLLWLGAAFVVAAPAHTGSPRWSLPALHLLGMGSLATLALAMVTRVSAGHGGRPHTADRVLWALFWGLQAALALRLVAQVRGGAWLAAAAAAWCAVVVPWAVRSAGWYGRPRPDGRPG